MSRLLSALGGDPLRLRTALSVVLTLLAALSVRIGGGGSDLAFVAAALAIGVALTRPPIEDTPANRRMWTVAVFVALLVSLWRAITQSAIIDSGTDFLLLLFVQRFYQRARTREHQQIILLSAVTMTVASVINVELSFPLLLLLYIPCTILALMINLLVAEGERLGPRVMYEFERIGAGRIRRLMRVSLQLAGVVLFGGLLVFVVFPRFGAGVFLRGSLPTRTVSGFSEEVSLGDFGTIKSDPTVVMRVTTDAVPPDTPTLNWYFRGAALDRYEDGRWASSGLATSLRLESRCGISVIRNDRTSRMSPVMTRDECVARLSPVPGFARAEEMLRATIVAEDLGVDVVFAPDIPAGVRLDRRGLLERTYIFGIGRAERLNLKRKQPGPIRYETFSRRALPSREELSIPAPTAAPLPEDPYLQLPEGLSPDFRALADALGRDTTLRIERVDAVLRHLRGLEYTLEQPEPPANSGVDPIEFFLFNAKAGHCEYFASAGALLLRAMGVRTRIVNGYLGGERNDFGGFYTVTQGDAHSWIEVHFDHLGWIRFDPTPSNGRRRQSTAQLFPAVQEYLDAIRNRYLGYVIDYNLRSQLDLLSNVGFQWSGRRFAVDRGRLATSTGVFVAFVVIVGGLWLRRRRPVMHEASRQYQRVIRALAARGLELGPEEGPRAFAARAQRAGFPAHERLMTFVTNYEAIRFGPSHDAAVPRDFLAQAQALRRAAQTWTPS